MIETHKTGAGTGSQAGSPGPLTRRVLDYTRAIERLLPVVKAPADWAPLAEFIAVDELERVGTFLEVQDWEQYSEMLTQWACATDSFATTLRRVSELPGLVYFEVEERHFRGDDVTTVNSMTAFEFNDEGKIHRLSVYLQQSL